MRYVTIDNIPENSILAMEVYDAYGRILLDCGKVLGQEYIQSLRRFGLRGVYIQDELTNDIIIDTLISAKLRGKGLECVREQNIEGCTIVAEDMVKELLEKDVICLELAEMKALDDFTYYHSVNVALYACAIGVSLKLPRKDLIELTTAGMLHDFGKKFISPDILNKNGRLTPMEFNTMRSHSKLGYNKIKESPILSDAIKDAVLSHHENVDGSGYPNGTTGNQQSLFTKILHVADVYDALISNRPYKKPYSTSEAIEYMMGGCNILFDQSIVMTLTQRVAHYPRGHQMQLSNGQQCIVVKNQGPHTMRPVVRLLTGETIDLLDKKNWDLTLSELDAVHISSEYEEQRKVMLGDTAKRLKLLVVDDMRTNLNALKSILEDEYDIQLCKSGQQAIDYFSAHIFDPPSLVLMDIDMPGLNGIDTAKIINNLADDKVPILFITALSNKETVLDCKEIGAAGYILRPYQPIFVKSEIRRIITGIDYTM